MKISIYSSSQPTIMSLTFKQYIYTILDVLYEDDLSKLYIKLKELNLTNYTKP